MDPKGEPLAGSPVLKQAGRAPGPACPAGEMPAGGEAGPVPAAGGLARRLLRWWPILLIVAAAAALYASGAQRFLSLDTLGERQEELRGLAAEYPLASMSAFIAATAVFLMTSLPAEGLLTALGGLVFGTLMGTLLSVAGTVAAAVMLFLALRHALSTPRPEPRAFVRGLRRRMQRDAVSYLLMLRLVPVLPFSLVSLLAVLVGMRLRAFTLATTAGVIPPTLVFASLGTGLRQVLGAHEAIRLSTFTSPGVLLPLVGLALLSLLPVVWRHWRRT